MLVITRRVMESVRIGDNIEVHVIRLQNGHVRLAIDAPREVHILRSELTKDNDRKEDKR